MSELALQEVEPELRSGVALDAIATSKRLHQREHRRPRALTAREALQALRREALIVWTVGATLLARRVEVTEGDWDRLTLACRTIDTIVDEAG